MLTGGAADVVVIEPDPATQDCPCPHQIVQYKCQTLIPTATLIWRLPSGDTLPEFGGGSSVGTVINSSDNQFSVTLTSKMEDDDPDTDFFFFTSTLLILEPINGSSLTCIACQWKFVSSEHYYYLEWYVYLLRLQ